MSILSNFKYFFQGVNANLYSQHHSISNILLFDNYHVILIKQAYDLVYICDFTLLIKLLRRVHNLYLYLSNLFFILFNLDSHKADF